MEIFTLCGCAVVVCVLVVSVRQYRSDMAVCLSVAAGIIMFLYILPALRAAADSVSEITAAVTLSESSASDVLRAAGICMITQLTADVCRDAGQTSMATKVELGGKAAVLLMMIPFFAKLLEATVKIING